MKIMYVIILLFIMAMPQLLAAQNFNLTNYTVESKKLKGNVKSLEFDEYEIFILESNLPDRSLDMSIKWTFNKQGFMESSYAFGRLGFYMKYQNDTLLTYDSKKTLYDFTIFNKSKKPLQYTLFRDTNIYTTYYTYYNSNKLKTIKDPAKNIYLYNYKEGKDKRVTIDNKLEKNNIYNQNLDLIEVNSGSNNFIVNTKYFYDINANLIREEYFYKYKSNSIWKKDTPVIAIFKYQYDSKGNWVNKKKFKHGKVVWESVRTIEYWD